MTNPAGAARSATGLRGKALAAITSLLLAAALMSVVIDGGSAGASAGTDAARAVSYASSHGYRTSIGVFDTQTGRFSGAGDYNSTYASESVVKVFIATRLLMTGQMSGWNETTAYKMITQSDDASANALYGRTGGDGVITWIKQTFNLPSLGSPPLSPGWWGSTRITARGMALFYNAVKNRASVWPWLANAMHHATRYGSDGQFQFFGIPSATTGSGVKQGWGNDNAAGQAAFNSTGFVNGDRFAVVILTQGGVYGWPIANMVTAEARYLMPGGRISSDSPEGTVDSLTLHGNVATVRGWSFDPNSTGSRIKIVVHVNGALAAYAPTTVSRPDVNAAYNITGTHGYAIAFRLSDGVKNVCVYATNLGAGVNRTLGCRSLNLTGAPLGAVDPVPLRANVATISGWTYDYDVPTYSLKAVVYVNGRLAAYGLTTVPSPAINTSYGITGAHRYSFKVRLPDGANRVCVYGINRGPGFNSTLGCRLVTLSGSPLGRVDSISVTKPAVATITGWTYDYDLPAQALKTVVYVNGHLAAYGPTTVNRTDVNSVYGITGIHGYSFSVGILPGANQVCVYGINTGPGANTTLGCRPITD
ncbi:MAG: hypothetical protein ABI808_00225 [Pseudonocardiales bacterium]